MYIIFVFICIVILITVILLNVITTDISDTELTQLKDPNPNPNPELDLDMGTENTERCCLLSKMNCNGDVCEPGVQKRCNELAGTSCQDSLALCEYMNEIECKSDYNLKLCSFDSNLNTCSKITDPYRGIDITCSEFDSYVSDGFKESQFNCENNLLLY
jgi:hypothetical protein